jgi:tetratricopeptide (TPR) repeat protein
MRKYVLVCLLIPVFLCDLACGGDPVATRDEHLQRGDAYVSSGKLSEAIVEYGAAVKADPNSGIAHAKLGDALLKANNVARAWRELVRAADLLPNDPAAQMKAGQALLATGQFDDARARAEKVLERDQRNVEAQILKGNALAGLKDFGGALTELESAIQTDPTRSAGYAHLGALQFARGNTEAAEASFKRAIAAEPQALPLRLALGNLYWSTNRPKEAEEAIRAALKIDPADALANKAMASILLGSKRAAEAEAHLKIVAEKTPTPEARLALADYYANVQRLPEAKVIYEKVAAAGGSQGVTARLRIVALGLLQGDRAGAEKLVDEILVKEPASVEALLAKAQIQASSGKTAEATATARKAVVAGPGSPMAHFVLGALLKNQYQNAEAEQAFKDALRVTPTFAPANVELARLAIVANRFSDAAAYAQAAISSVPGYGEAHLLLARAQMGSGNTDAAERSLKTMTSRFPNSPVVLAEAGRLRLIKGDRTGGRQLLEQALKQNPVLASAIEAVVVLDVQEGHRDAARRRLEAATAAAPDDREIQLLAARLYATQFSELAKAETIARRLIAKDGNDLTAFDTLARVYVQRGDLPAATREFENLAAKQPRSVTHHTAVGILYSLQGQMDKARESFQRALAIDPSAPLAANNLAQLYADKNENLDIALQLAKTAKAGMPTSHEVNDTLGWLYYKKNQALLAVSTLQSAVSAQPNNPVYLYHLGAAYALNKDKTNARQTLEKALSLGRFEGADDAKKVLDSLK